MKNVDEKFIIQALELTNAESANGQARWTKAQLEDFASMSDGCSGSVSLLYALFGRLISCHGCCVLHDFLYWLGGDKEARRKADKLLQRCAAASGKITPGWFEKLHKEKPALAVLVSGVVPMRLFWRWLRSWIFYAAVRLFGKSHWG